MGNSRLHSSRPLVKISPPIVVELKQFLAKSETIAEPFPSCAMTLMLEITITSPSLDRLAG